MRFIVVSKSWSWSNAEMVEDKEIRKEEEERDERTNSINKIWNSQQKYCLSLLKEEY